MHLTGTPIWCDARRRRDVCFVSAADRLGRAGHGQLIGTPKTIELLGGGPGHLAVPLRRPFTLGTLRLELFDSRRGVGAAALLVDLKTKRAVYAGELRTGADVRACDALVVAAPTDARKLPKLADAAARVIEWTRARLAARERPLLVVESLLDGFEIAEQLAKAEIAVTGSKSLRLPKARGAFVQVRGDREPAGQYVRTTVGLDGDFKWPFAMTRDELVAWIEQTGARELYITGPAAEAIATTLGPRARVLGPPRQMQLWG